MTNLQIDEFLKRVKNYYTNFDNVDVNVVKEWKKQIKDYENDSVNIQFDKYLGSEYNAYLPKVINLVRYAKKEGQNNNNISIRCPLCQQETLMSDYDKHYSRESSVNYVERMAKEYLTKDIDRAKYLSMDDAEFDERYDKLLFVLKDKVKEEYFHGASTRGLIEKILIKD